MRSDEEEESHACARVRVALLSRRRRKNSCSRCALSVVVERRQFSGRFGRRRVEVTGASPLCVGCHASVRCAVLLQRWLLALREAALAALVTNSSQRWRNRCYVSAVDLSKSLAYSVPL